MTGVIEVIDGGPLTTVQDAGRTGLAHLGVSPSGFLDVPAAKLANRLVGNDETAAVLETTGVDRGYASRDRSESAAVAVTGAPTTIHIEGRLADHHAPLLLHVGENCESGSPLRAAQLRRGARRLRGRAGARQPLHRSAEPPRAAAARRRAAAPVGGAHRPRPAVEDGCVSGQGRADPSEVYPGPSADWFAPEAMATLVGTTWTVDPASSRVGLRLSGPALKRSARELRPEGMVTGSIQVPPDGQPVLLLADHPTTGGYPVIAVARARDLPHAAQAAPGSRCVSG